MILSAKVTGHWETAQMMLLLLFTLLFKTGLFYSFLIFVVYFKSELSTNSTEQQNASTESSDGNEIDKKFTEYKVGDEVNCFVKSVR